MSLVVDTLGGSDFHPEGISDAVAVVYFMD